MDKNHPPLTFGVFKPTGYTLMAFRTHEALLDAMRQVIGLGFEGASMVQYDAEEMRHLLDDELANASPLSRFGYEVQLSRQHRMLAEQGCCFLLVHAPNTKHEDQITALVERLHPATAQHYGRFLIRDLTENVPGSPAVH
jgi:hypothetical protein